MKTIEQIELDQIYNSIVAAYQVSAADDEPTKIAKLLGEIFLSVKSLESQRSG